MSFAVSFVTLQLITPTVSTRASPAEKHSLSQCPHRFPHPNFVFVFVFVVVVVSSLQETYAKMIVIKLRYTRLLYPWYTLYTVHGTCLRCVPANLFRFRFGTRLCCFAPFLGSRVPLGTCKFSTVGQGCWLRLEINLHTE